MGCFVKSALKAWIGDEATPSHCRTYHRPQRHRLLYPPDPSAMRRDSPSQVLIPTPTRRQKLTERPLRARVSRKPHERPALDRPTRRPHSETASDAVRRRPPPRGGVEAARREAAGRGAPPRRRGRQRRARPRRSTRRSPSTPRRRRRSRPSSRRRRRRASTSLLLRCIVAGHCRPPGWT